jgi:hypothetical protein
MRLRLKLKLATPQLLVRVNGALVPWKPKSRKRQMKICPTCSSSTDVLFINTVTKMRFCRRCAARECPSCLLLTLSDVDFLCDCGIDAQDFLRFVTFLDAPFERVGGGTGQEEK